MSFEAPLALLALAALPLLLGAYAWWELRRGSAAARFATPALLPNVVHRRPGPIRHLPPALFLLALAALLVGFARPHANLKVPREEASVILAIDRSRSMFAEDVVPTRMAAAQSAAKTFIAEVPSKFRVGVVTFSTQATVAAPPTTNREAVLAAIDRITPGSGTAIGDAIGRSLEAGKGLPPGSTQLRGLQRFRPNGIPVAIVLLSDGAQTQGTLTPVQASRAARVLDVPVYTVALGTDQGVVERQLPGGLTERIVVPPDPETLARIAEMTGGETFAVERADRLRAVYQDLGSRLGHKVERKEVTVAFAAGGAALLLAAGAASVLLLHRLP